MSKIFTKKAIILTTVILIIGFILYLYLSVFMPIILAFFTALILEPLVQLLQKTFRSKTRLPAVLVTFILFVCFVATLFFLAITKLVNETIKFLHRLPYYVVEFNLFVEDVIQRFNEAVETLPPGIVTEIQNQGQMVYNKTQLYGQMAVEQLTSFIQGVPNFIVISLVYLITLFLISIDLPRIKEGFYAYFKEENAVKVRYMFERLDNVFVGFFKAQFLISIVIFIVTYIGLLIISPRNALFISIIIWIIDVIPIIGSIIFLAPWFLYCFIIGETAMGFKLMILATILLTLRRTLEPKIMGDQIGLSPLLTLISIYLGFNFLGALGLILGPLLFIAVKSAIEAEVIQIDFKI